MPIHGYPGGVITANPVAPTASVATGVWTTEQQLQAKAAGNWPFAAQQISRSLRFNSPDTTYLNRTPASASNRKTWTWSGWVKRGILNSSAGAAYPLFAVPTGTTDSTWFELRFISDFLYIAGYSTNWRITSQVFRDPSAWYHIVLSVDTTQATANDRLKLYVNGTQVTTFSTTNNPTQNADLGVNQAAATYIGFSNTQYFDGYLTEVNFIDGQALTPSSFGRTNKDTGVWEPIAYSGTYGTNGFYLNFSDNSNTTATTLGKDYSGNGNNWTPNNFSVTPGNGDDSLVDTPTSYGTDTGVGGEVRGNYCTWNPLFNNQTGISSSNTGTVTITNGNLTVAPTSSSIAGTVGTIGVSSGKWYFEYTVGAASPSGDVAGFITSFSGANTTWIGYRTTGVIYNNGSSTSGYATATAGDIIGIALDIGGSTISCYKNNTLLATTALNTAITADCFPLIWFRNDTGSGSVNFGQRAFAYTAPSGFKALCTQNLPTPTIGATSTTQANRYMDIKLYTGNGGQQTQTGLNFKPDFIWVKSRSNAYDNGLANAVTGTGKYLVSNSTAAEVTDASGSIIAFNANGFGQGGSNPFGANAATYAAWCWRASNAAGSTNTAGTITSTVSASTTSGFSIVTFTADSGTNNFTVGHGLGVTPSMVIVKSRTDAVAPWYVYHSSLVTDGYLRLNATNAVATATNQWGTGMTSTVIGLRAGYSTVASTTTVAYAFAPVAGYSAFGSYTGNGSTDGPFVYVGFRPRYVLIKRTDSTANWEIWDTTRSVYNQTYNALYPNLSNAEDGGNAIDINSNGFKLRDTGGSTNATASATYIYAAFAESPFKYALAR